MRWETRGEWKPTNELAFVGNEKIGDGKVILHQKWERAIEFRYSCFGKKYHDTETDWRKVPHYTTILGRRYE